MNSRLSPGLEGCRILAVHHDPGLNGAALLFESVIEGLARDYGASITTRFPHDGPLVARAGRIGPVQVGDPPGVGRLRKVINRVAGRAGQGTPWVTCDMIFANTIASLGPVERLLARYPALGTVPIVVYVHESAFLLQEFDFEATKRMLRRARLIFAVSSSVRETLEAVVQPEGKIAVVGGFLLERSRNGAASDLPPVVREALRSDTQIVGGVGTLAWHKGTDLFIAVARRLRDLLPSHPKFIWIGQEWTPDIRRLLERDIERAGLTDTVFLPGPTQDPHAFFESLSVLLLPSREDSWPLVMLESAAAGVPIVCFQRAGGAEEFIANGGGIAVPYLDVEAMARAVARYLTEPGVRARDSEIARELARAVTRDAQIGKVASEIELMLRSRSPTSLPA